MSLVRLLTAGKSLVGAQNGESRYRVRKEVALPKFVSIKNPFAEAAPPSAPLKPSAGPSAVRSLTPAEVAAARLKETKQIPLRAAHRDVVPREADQPKPSPRAARTLLDKLNPFSIWDQIKPAPKPAIPNFNRTPVQSELSLDAVKVVRNDLRDSDLEVVPLKSSTVSVERVASAGERGSRGGGNRWEQLTARVFGGAEP